jgi:hypothetical protein
LLAAGLSGPGTQPTLPLGGYFPVPSIEDLAPHFPQLEILELLGRGGMGTVYRARQTNLDRPVALKILSPHLVQDPGFIERFTREARMMARLSHPNIVAVYDFGQAGGHCYLVMELVDGVNLREAIAAQAITPDQALAIVPKICDALQYAHDQNVIHRDIKPENILIGRRDEVKIADFGLAKLLNSAGQDVSLTGTHQVLGTRNYMAPEQIERPGSVDHRADIFSLGVVFYELLTGELPLGRFSPPSQMAQVNPGLDEIVLRTLEKEPARRYQQASAVRTAVQAVSEARPRAQYPESPVPPVLYHQGAEVAGKPLPPRERLSLPFYNDDLNCGLSKLHGLAHLDANGLVIEYRVRRFGMVSTETRRKTIPGQDVVRATYTRGILTNSLAIQSGRLDAFDGIPGCTQGTLTMYLDKQQHELSQQFCDRLNRMATTPAPVDQRPATGTLPVPFSVDLTFGSAAGFAKLLDRTVRIEFQKSDWLGNAEATRTVDIPVSRLVRIDYRSGIFWDRVSVQADSLDLVRDFPESTQGRIDLTTRKVDREIAMNFVSSVSMQAGLPAPRSAVESKSGVPAASARSTRQQLLGVRIGLLASLLINLVCLVAITASNVPAIGDSLIDAGRDNWFVSKVVNRIIDSDLRLTDFDAWKLLLCTLVASIAAMIAFNRLSRFQSLPLVVFLLLLVAVPVHPGVYVALPSAVYGLIVLFRSGAHEQFE